MATIPVVTWWTLTATPNDKQNNPVTLSVGSGAGGTLTVQCTEGHAEGPPIRVLNPLTIDSEGNIGLGIGTGSPAYGLHLALGKTLRIEGGTNPNDTADYFSFGGWGVFGVDAPGVPNGRLVVLGSGNVGVGTSNPVTALEVARSGSGGMGPALTLTNTGGGANSSAAIDFNTFPESYTGGYNPSARIMAIDNGNFANDIIFLSNQPGKASNGLVERMRITSAGNLTVPGDILLTGADCAEQFDAAGEMPEPGNVVVIDEAGALRVSRDAYDKKVAGVVSGAGDYRHALILDKRSSDEGRVPVALMGKVYCKVDARYSPVDVGDLLTTSPTPGHAMKASEPNRAFGSVIGKALRSLAQGQGLVPILIALQ